MPLCCTPSMLNTIHQHLPNHAAMCALLPHTTLSNRPRQQLLAPPGDNVGEPSAQAHGHHAAICRRRRQRSAHSPIILLPAYPVPPCIPAAPPTAPSKPADVVGLPHTDHPSDFSLFFFQTPCTTVQLGRLALEWNALTEARDKHIRGQFTREQKLLRAEKILALRTMLEDLCDEVSSDAERGKGFTACTGVATTAPVPALRAPRTARAGAVWRAAAGLHSLNSRLPRSCWCCVCPTFLGVPSPIRAL